MDPFYWKEAIGYLAPVFIVLSMAQSNLRLVRLLMLAGCLTFVVYGVVVEAWPVVVANALIGIVTLYYLVRSQNVKQEFSLLNLKALNPDLLKRFIEAHRSDLNVWYPRIDDILRSDENAVLFFMHELEPVGIFSYRKGEAGVVELLADYVAPQFRDERTENYLYGTNEGHLIQEGVQKVIMRTQESCVKEEMQRFGFEEQEPGVLVKHL